MTCTGQKGYISKGGKNLEIWLIIAGNALYIIHNYFQFFTPLEIYNLRQVLVLYKECIGKY